MSRLHSFLSMSPLKIALGYLVFGVLWVPATDVLLAVTVPSQDLPTLVGLANSWTFIGLSALLIYASTRAHHGRMSTAQRKLQTANEQLQVLHRVFRHNIRNDINVIQGYAQILVENVEQTTAKMHAETVRQTAEGITTISEKLKMVEGVDPTVADEGVVDLVDLVETELDRIKTVANSVELTVDLPDHAWVDGDESIEYAVREVLENAVVHNDKPTCEITVTADRVGGEVMLQVEDNGPGIPGEELRSLQSGEETALMHASSVGLWLVRWMCQMHDGDVCFSTASANGTVVTFHFQADSQRPLLETETTVSERIETVAT